MAVKTIVTDDKVIRVETTEFERVVDYDDIESSVEYDDGYNETPWDSCDGWEHEFHIDYYHIHVGVRNSYAWVEKPLHRNGRGYIEIDDADVIRWGCAGYPGCSKQVRAESIARTKRATTIQLVEWYENGCNWYAASAKYGDYHNGCGGIDGPVYAEEVAEECRREVAAEMESDGYIVENQPDPPKPYNRVDSFRDQIRRNLNL